MVVTYIYFRISQITGYLFPKCPNRLYDILKQGYAVMKMPFTHHETVHVITRNGLFRNTGKSFS